MQVAQKKHIIQQFVSIDAQAEHANEEVSAQAGHAVLGTGSQRAAQAGQHFGKAYTK